MPQREAHARDSGKRPRAVRRDDPFSYPATLPASAAYRELDVEPQASDQEVKWAKGVRIEDLETEKGELQQKLQALYERVPGLREALRDGAAGAAGDDGGAEDGRVAGARRRQELEREARGIDPEFPDWRRRVTEIEGLINRLNALALDNADKRLEHDRRHPPLPLLRLADCCRFEPLDDVRAMLVLLRRELSRALAEEGEVFHPSDLTREDFGGDFRAHELLDGAER